MNVIYVAAKPESRGMNLRRLRSLWFGLFLAVMFMDGFGGAQQTWHADNGNGTFTNPLFYEEFSDPDIVRVGDDFYMTGTTMHAMPGLPVLHSKDLINWDLLGYAFDKLDFGPPYRLEGGQDIYGRGIWAPSIRYHNGHFYIFSDVNGQRTQLFTATNPAGPWQHTQMNGSYHDISVLFDDDGRVYAVWGAHDLHTAQLSSDLKDLVPSTEHVLFAKNAGMNEGTHFYKIQGKYYITNVWWLTSPMRMVCARADKPDGPYEINPAISKGEDFGLAEGPRLLNPRRPPPYAIVPGNTLDKGTDALAQGGLVQTPTGEWWGFAHMDYNSIGRLTSLSPITWKDGWPYFGLAGNLMRTPRTWAKPNTGHNSPPSAPFQRNDDFSGPRLANVWQWNHVEDDAEWSLSERPGYLRLHSLPAPNFWFARNTLTQRAIGPESIPTAVLDASGLKSGDIAGVALLTAPYAWLGVVHQPDGFVLEQFSELTNQTDRVRLPGSKVWLRAHCNFLTEKAEFTYSTDGTNFIPIGKEVAMIFSIKTFQGVRYSLFNFNTDGRNGGYADFDSFTVDEPHPHGLMRPIPLGKSVTFINNVDDAPMAIAGETQFYVMDRSLGRVALKTPHGLLSVSQTGEVTLKRGKPTQAETFQWIETPYGDLVLLSLMTDRSLQIAPGGILSANSLGPKPNRKDGSCLTWKIAGRLSRSATIARPGSIQSE